MPLTFQMVASEILMCGLKMVPVAGRALEVVDAIRAKHEMTGYVDRLAEVESQLTRFEKRQRDLVAEEMRSILGTLGSPNLGGPALTEEIRNLRQIQEQGWNPNLFEGLLLNSSHRDELKRNPQHYGRILDDHDPVDLAKGIYLLLDADKTRLLELPPFAFAQLLANQPKGVPEAKIQVGEGIWAFPERASVAQPAPVKQEPIAARRVLVPPSATPPEPAAPARLTNSIGMTLVRIEPGSFTMGSDETDDEKPPHQVRITKAFYLGAHQVTQKQYQAVIGHNPSYFKKSHDLPVETRVAWALGPSFTRHNPSNFKDSHDLPVEMVSWLDAVFFCNKLSEREKRSPYYRISGTSVTIEGGNGYRLPTEAQWEYACRAGTTTPYPWGFSAAGLDDSAWFDKNSGKQTHPVGQKLPNDWGLYDMLGNVWEVCEDLHDARYYEKSPGDDPTGPGAGASLHVIRGGGYSDRSQECRPAFRSQGAPETYRTPSTGFRLAASLES